LTRILVVDDLKDITETMGVLFEALGHDTKVAADGRQAVHTTLEFEPDIIFLDLDMPVLNGYEAAREIRGAPLPRQPFLIALTKAHGSTVEVTTRAVGFDLPAQAGRHQCLAGAGGRPVHAHAPGGLRRR